jgi:putative oxidoreductase
MAPVRALAHALLGSIFVAAGTQALLHPRLYAERAAPITDRLSPALAKVDDRLPTSAETLIRINGAIQVSGGLLLATGKAVRPAAAVLTGSLIPWTVVGHPFWRARDKVAKQDELVHFMKNLGLFGGLLLAAVDTQGKPGLPWRTRRLYTDTTKSVKRAVHTASREAKLVARATEVGRHLPS